MANDLVTTQKDPATYQSCLEVSRNCPARLEFLVKLNDSRLVEDSECLEAGRINFLMKLHESGLMEDSACLAVSRSCPARLEFLAKLKNESMLVEDSECLEAAGIQFLAKLKERLVQDLGCLEVSRSCPARLEFLAKLDNERLGQKGVASRLLEDSEKAERRLEDLILLAWQRRNSQRRAQLSVKEGKGGKQKTHRAK